MLFANSTRDLNQAARAAARFLKDQGFSLSHSKSLDLVARLTGAANHMAGQSTLPDVGLATAVKLGSYADLKRALSLLTDDQLKMSITVSEGCDENGNAEFFPGYEFVLAGDPSLEAGSDGVLEAEQPVLLFNGPFDEPLGADLPPDDGASLPAVTAVVAKLEDGRDYLRQAVAKEMEPFYDAMAPDADDLAGVQNAPKVKMSTSTHRGRVNIEEMRRVGAQFELASNQPGWIGERAVMSMGLAEALASLNQEHDLQLALGDFIIWSETEEGFWCNDFGWSSSHLAATGYATNLEADLEGIRAMVPDACFVRFDGAVDPE